MLMEVKQCIQVETHVNLNYNAWANIYANKASKPIKPLIFARIRITVLKVLTYYVFVVITNFLVNKNYSNEKAIVFIGRDLFGSKRNYLITLMIFVGVSNITYRTVLWEISTK